jgi:hypothetical protein
VDVNNLDEHPAICLKMNEIGSVEFETSQPLFFDSYAQNRTTGSLILIDELTNATVGAVMIREELPLVSEVPGDAGAIANAARRGEVTLDERIERRGHRPAIFTLDDDRGGAEELERALLERGFETVLVHYRDVHAPSRRILLTTLWNLGLVIICWEETGIRTRERALFDSLAGKSHFDLSHGKLANRGPNRLARAVSIAETLRGASEPDVEREGD